VDISALIFSEQLPPVRGRELTNVRIGYERPAVLEHRIDPIEETVHHLLQIVEEACQKKGGVQDCEEFPQARMRLPTGLRAVARSN